MKRDELFSTYPCALEERCSLAVGCGNSAVRRGEGLRVRLEVIDWRRDHVSVQQDESFSTDLQ